MKIKFGLFVLFFLLGISLSAQDLEQSDLLATPLLELNGVYHIELDGEIRDIEIISETAQFEERKQTGEVSCMGTVANNEIGFILVPTTSGTDALISEPVRIVILESESNQLLVEVRFLNSRNGRVINVLKD